MTGLLNEIAKELAISVAAAGRLMSAYSLALAIGAPLLTPLSKHLDRRTLIVAELVLFGGVLTAAGRLQASKT